MRAHNKEGKSENKTKCRLNVIRLAFEETNDVRSIVDVKLK